MFVSVLPPASVLLKQAAWGMTGVAVSRSRYAWIIKPDTDR